MTPTASLNPPRRSARKHAALAAAAVLLAWSTCGPASAADPFLLVDEEVVPVTGRVVDLRCALTGDCPDACGAGARVLGVETPEGSLVAVVKGASNFAGAVRELLPHCGERVELDGLFVGNLRTRLYFVQRLRREGSAEWIEATQFQRDFAASRPDLPPDADFTEHDPRIQDLLRRTGTTGER